MHANERDHSFIVSMCDHACVLCLYIRACSRCESVFMSVSEIMHCVFMCCIPLLALCVCV